MKARFSEKLPLQRFAEEIFYAMLNSGKLHAAVLNEEHKVRLCALVKDFLMIFVTGGGSSSGDFYKKAVSVNLLRHKCWLHTMLLRAESSLSVANNCLSCGYAGTTYPIVMRSTPR